MQKYEFSIFQTFVKVCIFYWKNYHIISLLSRYLLEYCRDSCKFKFFYISLKSYISRTQFYILFSSVFLYELILIKNSRYENIMQTQTFDKKKYNLKCH